MTPPLSSGLKPCRALTPDEARVVRRRALRFLAVAGVGLGVALLLLVASISALAGASGPWQWSWLGWLALVAVISLVAVWGLREGLRYFAVRPGEPVYRIHGFLHSVATGGAHGAARTLGSRQVDFSDPRLERSLAPYRLVAAEAIIVQGSADPLIVSATQPGVGMGRGASGVDASDEVVERIIAGLDGVGEVDSEWSAVGLARGYADALEAFAYAGHSRGADLSRPAPRSAPALRGWEAATAYVERIGREDPLALEALYVSVKQLSRRPFVFQLFDVVYGEGLYHRMPRE